MIKPILFNGAMARAIQNGTKTVTRRVIKPQPGVDGLKFCYASSKKGDINKWIGCGRRWVPPCRPGDILYVRETWHQTPNGLYWYKADNICNGCTEDGVCLPKDVPYHQTCKLCEYLCGHEFIKWRPSIHMPREAARLFLRVKSVTVERLQDITDEQARLEGAKKEYQHYMDNVVTEREVFSGIWNSTIKPADRTLYGWEASPWVWVILFERISKEETERGL